jgi:creatinine amidohydrolase/Fe(II)-dependent formamide hydrolase-like protein
MDLWANPAIKRPYPFEIKMTSSHHPVNPPRDKGKSTFLLGELTWPEARERFREVDVALLLVGAVEQHGPHLPLDCDAFDAEHIASRVAEGCNEPRPLVLPLVPFGVSYHHEDFSGTISINPETLSQLVYDIGMSAVRHGITKLVIINGHGGNGPALHFAAQMINRDAHIFLEFIEDLKSLSLDEIYQKRY